MSSVSVTSSKREVKTSEKDLLIEIEAYRALNSSLRAYLDHVRMVKKHLIEMKSNCKELRKVNAQWVDTLNAMK